MNIFLKSAGKQEGTSCVSNMVQLGDFFYLSGQNGLGESIQEQTITAINKVIDVLSNYGLQLHHVVKFTVYLKNIEDKEAFLNTFKNFVDEPFPACTIVEVSNLADNATVCIEGLGVNTLRHEEQMQQSSCSHDNQLRKFISEISADQLRYRRSSGKRSL